MSVPLLLNRYSIIGVLQENAYVSVLRAFDTATNHEVVIKVLSMGRVPDAGSYQAIEETFAREFEVGIRTRGHPHLVAIYDYAGDGNQARCLVIEYVAGGTLLYPLHNGLLSLPQVIAICADVARGLQAAHQVRVVHTALTPASIYLTPEGRAKVGDFGDAQVDGLPAYPSPATDFAYRAHYRSPEQSIGGAVSPQVDQFSLGAILFEMLSGAPYAPNDNPVRTTVLASQPPPVALLIERLTASAPEARYPSMREALNAILGVQESFGPPMPAPVMAAMPQPPPQVPVAAPAVRRRAVLAGIVGVIAVGAAGGAGVFALRRRSDGTTVQPATPTAVITAMAVAPSPTVPAATATPVALPTLPLATPTVAAATIPPTMPTAPPPIVTATPVAIPTAPPPALTATPVALPTMPPPTSLPPTATVAPARTFSPQPALSTNAIPADMTDASQWLIVSTPSVTTMLKDGAYLVQVAKKADGKGAIAWGDWVPKNLKLTPQFQAEVVMKLMGMPPTTAGGILFNFNYVPSDRRNEQQFLLFLARGDGRYALFQQFPGGSDQFRARLDYGDAFPVKIAPDAPIVVGVEVRGKQLGCAVNGQRVLTLEIPAEVATFSAVALAAQVQEGSTTPEISATFSNLRYDPIAL